jgi:hypothetical protein
MILAAPSKKQKQSWRLSQLSDNLSPKAHLLETVDCSSSHGLARKSSREAFHEPAFHPLFSINSLSSEDHCLAYSLHARDQIKTPGYIPSASDLSIVEAAMLQYTRLAASSDWAWTARECLVCSQSLQEALPGGGQIFDGRPFDWVHLPCALRKGLGETETSPLARLSICSTEDRTSPLHSCRRH